MKSELNHFFATYHELTSRFHFFMSPNHRSKSPRSKADWRICRRILLFSLLGLYVMEEACVWESTALFSLLFLLTEAQGVFVCFPNRCHCTAHKNNYKLLGQKTTFLDFLGREPWIFSLEPNWIFMIITFVMIPTWSQLIPSHIFRDMMNT